MSAIYAIVVDPDVTGRHDRSVARILGTVSLLQAALDLRPRYAQNRTEGKQAIEVRGTIY